MYTQLQRLCVVLGCNGRMVSKKDRLNMKAEQHLSLGKTHDQCPLLLKMYSRLSGAILTYVQTQF